MRRGSFKVFTSPTPKHDGNWTANVATLGHCCRCSMPHGHSISV